MDERLRKEKMEFVLTPESGTDVGINVKLCPKILQLSALLKVDIPSYNVKNGPGARQRTTVEISY